jgi:hypothetical protein
MKPFTKITRKAFEELGDKSPMETVDVSPYATDVMPVGFTEGCWYNYKEIESLERRVKDLEEIVTILVEKLNKAK